MDGATTLNNTLAVVGDKATGFGRGPHRGWGDDPQQHPDGRWRQGHRVGRGPHSGRGNDPQQHPDSGWRQGNGFSGVLMVEGATTLDDTLTVVGDKATG